MQPWELVWRAGLVLGLVAGLRGLPRADARPPVTRHEGMFNASAALALDARHFVAASDEDNRLRVYRLDQPGGPVLEVDLSGFLGVHGRGMEADIEGAARLGDLGYWIGSHGASREGRARPNRQRLFAVHFAGPADAPRLEPVGRPCRTLGSVLLADPRYRRQGLAGLRPEQPPEEGGLNIEGLAALGADGLLIGLRGPLAGGKAILAPLLNPRAALDGEAPRLGDPILLDLHGQGIRDLAWSGREYFLIAGGAEGGGKPRLYRWPGPGKDPSPIEHKGLKNFNPEALVVFGEPDRLRLLLLSDDGRAKGASEGRGLPRFRSFWVDP